ncbi:MAG: glycosyltransferase family 39 protein [Pseudomonadota bacterium]
MAWAPWLLLALALLLKGTELWVDPDLFLDWESLGRGLLARELLDGPAYGLLDYQMDPYAGGSLVMGLVAVPLFGLFGDSVFVLHLATLPFLAATAAATWVLVRRQLDQGAALLAMALVLFAPYPAARLAGVAWGDNVQVPLFMALALTLAAPLAQGASRNPWRVGLLGGVAGFGFYYHYHFAIPLALLGLLLLAGDRAWLHRPSSWAALAAGLVFGLVPWLAYNLGHSWEGLVISTYGAVDHMGSGVLARYPGRLLALCFAVPARSLGPGPAFWRWSLALSLLAWLAFLAAAGFLAWRERRAPSWVRRYLLLYPPFFVLLAAATPFSFVNEPDWYFADRYLASLHWVVAVVVALAAATLWRQGGAVRWAGGGLAGTYLAIGILAQGVILFGHPPRGPLHARGPDGAWERAYDWTMLADDRIAFGFYRGDLAPCLGSIRASEGRRRVALCRALGVSMTWRLGPDRVALEEGARALEPLGPHAVEAFWSGAGVGAGRWWSGRLDEALPAMRGHPWELAWYDGLETTLYWWYGGDRAEAAATIVTFTEGDVRLGLLEKLGAAIGEADKRDAGRCAAEVAASVPAAWRAPVLDGLCRDLAKHVVDLPAALDEVQASTLPAEGRERLLACLGGAR